MKKELILIESCQCNLNCSYCEINNSIEDDINIVKNKYNITPVSIKRTNDYHSLKANNKIISASAIRSLIKNKKRFKKYVPTLSYKYINLLVFFEMEYLHFYISYTYLQKDEHSN